MKTLGTILFFLFSLSVLFLVSRTYGGQVGESAKFRN